MSLSILGVVTEFCGLRGLPIPTAVIGSTDRSVLQYLAIIKQVGRELSTYKWAEQKVQGTFQSVATPAQGNVKELLSPADPALFGEIIPNTFWNTDRLLAVTGPMTDMEFAALTTLSLSGVPFRYTIIGGQLMLSPTPDADETFTCMYSTTAPFTDSTGSQAKAAPTVDSDVLLFPDRVVMKGFEYLWKKQKGEAFTADQNEFLSLIADALAPKAPILRLDCATPNVRPRIVIPPGSWNV